jgi:N utilization substance protein B
MTKTRSELREKCMIILYQNEIINKGKIKTPIEEIIKDNLEYDSEFVNEIVNGVLNNYDELNKIANEHMKDWTIDRIDKTGASILRMGIYELKHTDTPPVVVINEAIELAKKYSDDNVRKIINAVLDKLIRE